jgi:hypothetical protein
MCFSWLPTRAQRLLLPGLASNQIIILRHVLFDESSFPFTEISNPPSSSFDFMSELDCTPLPIGTNPLAGSSSIVALMVLCLRLLPAVPGSSPHWHFPWRR